MSWHGGRRHALQPLVERLRTLGSHSRQPLAEAAFTVVDTELTGLDPDSDEILAIGFIRMIGTRILVGETLFSAIRPERRAWGASVPVHGIRPVDVQHASPAEAVLPALIDFCKGTVMVGYGVDLDRRVLERSLARLGKDELPRLWLDIARVERWLRSRAGRLPEAGAWERLPTLATLAQQAGIPVPATHHALADAFVAAQLWQRQLARLLAERVTTVGDLALIGALRRSAGPRR